MTFATRSAGSPRPSVMTPGARKSIRRFVRPGLDSRDERQAAQSLINYWVSRATSGERKKATQSAEPVFGPEFDTLLAEFDPDALRAAIADADARLEKIAADPKLVHRILR